METPSEDLRLLERQLKCFHFQRHSGRALLVLFSMVAHCWERGKKKRLRVGPTIPEKLDTSEIITGFGPDVAYKDPEASIVYRNDL